MKPISIDDALEAVSVHPPGMWDNDDGPEDWYAISDDDGIKAYANTEELACFIRLALINATLNPVQASIA